MNKLVQVFVIGALIIAAVKLFHWEERFSEKTLARVRAGIKGEPEQLVVAAGMVTLLGAAAVIAAQAFRKVS